MGGSAKKENIYFFPLFFSVWFLGFVGVGSGNFEVRLRDENLTSKLPSSLVWLVMGLVWNIKLWTEIVDGISQR